MAFTIRVTHAFPLAMLTGAPPVSPGHVAPDDLLIVAPFTEYPVIVARPIPMCYDAILNLLETGRAELISHHHSVAELAAAVGCVSPNRPPPATPARRSPRQPLVRLK